MDRPTRGTFALLLSVAACGTGNGEDVSPGIEAAVLEVGGTATAALMGSLITHLTDAMQEGGPINAVEFCSTAAAELTAGVASEQGLDVKRTTLRYRNPANAPDQAETEALRHFESALVETGALPGPWVQKVGRDEYRYYRPLTVAPPCLKCHGTAEEIDPAVQAILAERYPDDLATDYSVGDFRGVVRVSIPADMVEASGD